MVIDHGTFEPSVTDTEISKTFQGAFSSVAIKFYEQSVGLRDTTHIYNKNRT